MRSVLLGQPARRLMFVFVAVVVGLACWPLAATAAPVLLAAPSPRGSRGDRFAGVSCTDDTDCLAVGSFLTANRRREGLIEGWNGVRWTIVSDGPISGLQPVFLESISCATSGWCMAVGTGQRGKAWLPVAERWDGSRWHVTAPVALGGATANGDLSSVSCAAPGECSAVGGYLRGDGGAAIAQRWQDGKWTLAYRSKPVSHGDARLNAVSCESANSCVAVGGHTTRRAAHGTMLRWGGTRWQPVHVGLPGRSELRSVSCPDATSCLLVGSQTVGHVAPPVADQLTGGHLTTLPIAAGEGAGEFYDVSCATAIRCLALGATIPDSGQGTAQAWDGTGFKYVFGAPGSGIPPWSAASCRPSFCILAGAAGRHVLTERYDFPISPQP